MRPRQPATYAEFLEVPDTKVAEMLEGELVVSPRPAFRHSLVSSELGAELIGKFQRRRPGPGGWWILDEPELHFGADILVPDLAGWRRERLPTIPDVNFMSLAPDWICEVLSPSTETLDRSKKLKIYRAGEVKHAWLINPTTRTLEVLRVDRAGWLLVGTYMKDALVRAEPFEAEELDLLPLWGETRPA